MLPMFTWFDRGAWLDPILDLDKPLETFPVASVKSDILRSKQVRPPVRTDPLVLDAEAFLSEKVCTECLKGMAV